MGTVLVAAGLALGAFLAPAAWADQPFDPSMLSPADHAILLNILEFERSNVRRELPASGRAVAVTLTETSPRVCRHFVIAAGDGAGLHGVGCRTGPGQWDLAASSDRIPAGTAPPAAAAPAATTPPPPRQEPATADAAPAAPAAPRPSTPMAVVPPVLPDERQAAEAAPEPSATAARPQSAALPPLPLPIPPNRQRQEGAADPSAEGGPAEGDYPFPPHKPGAGPATAANADVGADARAAAADTDAAAAAPPGATDGPEIPLPPAKPDEG